MVVPSPFSNRPSGSLTYPVYSTNTLSLVTTSTVSFNHVRNTLLKGTPPPGIEPGTFSSESRRATSNHCANEAYNNVTNHYHLY